MSANWVLVISSAVLLLAGGAGLFWYFYRKNNPKVAKSQGKDTAKQSAVSAVRRFARSNGFRVIAPANLAKNGRFANLDAVVVGYFGVLGVKAYGYNGEIYGNASDEKWLQMAADGTRNYFLNPVAEAAKDVRVIRDALFGYKMKTVPVEVVCVFTNPKVQMAVPRSVPYLTQKTFKQLLDKEKYLQDTGLDIDVVEKALQEALVGAAAADD